MLLIMTSIYAANHIRVSPEEALKNKMKILASGDKSTVLAIENDFYQPIGMSQSKEGITITLDGMVVDKVSVQVFYTITADENVLPEGDDMHVYRINPMLHMIVDGQKHEPPGFMGSWSRPDNQHGNVYEDVLEYTFLNEIMMDGIQVDLQPQIELETAQSEGEPFFQEQFLFDIPIDPSTYDYEILTYEINEELTIEQQKIVFHDMIVHPTRSTLYIAVDEDNSKEIFDMGDMELVVSDDNKGITSQQKSVQFGRDQITFESMYFMDVEHVAIEGSWFGALDKDKRELVINMEQGKIVKKPDDRLTLGSIEQQKDGELEIQFIMDGGEGDRFFFHLDTAFTDADGDEYENFVKYHRSTSNKDGGILNVMHTTIPDEDYVSPLTFNISHYPTHIEEPYSIDVK